MSDAVTQARHWKFVDDELLARLSAGARAAPRRRLNHNLHASADEPIQRMLNAMEPDSYVRPHVHPDKWELLVVLRGSFDVLFFESDGVLAARHRIVAGAQRAPRLAVHASNGSGQMIEFAGGTWHALVALEPGSVFFEIKPGPWTRTAPHEFAAWAPSEGGASVAAFLARMQSLRPGECA